MDDTERARLIAMYREGPARLRAAWDQVPAAARHFRPAPGAWSAHEIIVHCADSETYAATRIRLLVAEPEPLIVGYDQEAWARLFDYETASVESSFAVIDAIRAHTATFIERLDDAGWARTGSHTETGTYRATDWLESYGNHLHDHARQIQANLDAWTAKQ
jgi:hypothetical protein